MKNKKYKQYLEIEVYKYCNEYKWLRRLIKRFIAAHIIPSTNAVFLIRKMQVLYSSNRINRYRALLIQNKLVRKYGIHINPNTKIDLGLRIPHPTSIVIGAKVSIGKYFTIYQNTTVGGSRVGDVIKGNQPDIGNNVTMFAGSMALGKIEIGDNCSIGANSVLISNADKDCNYVGSPARKV
jgi:serine acetyltransferase